MLAGKSPQNLQDILTELFVFILDPGRGGCYPPFFQIQKNFLRVPVILNGPGVDGHYATPSKDSFI
jgi:hypothetical protein